MIALEDLGFFARYIFDNRSAMSAQELEIASDYVDWPYLIDTFIKVTGSKAEHKALTIEQWADLFTGMEQAVHMDDQGKEGVTTLREHSIMWWNIYADDLPKRDLDQLRAIHPGLLSVEDWMRKYGYTGELKPPLLKNHADRGRSFVPDQTALDRL